MPLPLQPHKLHLPVGLDPTALRMREYHLSIFTQLTSRGIDIHRMTAPEFSSILLSLAESNPIPDPPSETTLHATCPTCKLEFDEKHYLDLDELMPDPPTTAPFIPSTLLSSLPKLQRD